ncbi:MAG: DUF2723 domain-containing protein [bacterium]|nr:DUF2723 domain-containing protein [bacterium]
MARKKIRQKPQKKKDSFKHRFFNLKEEIAPLPFNTLQYILGILVLFASFLVYLKTLTPDIGFHDSGDMIPASFHLGICHPPGYPFYNLFGKLFSTLLPIGNIAYRFNLMSAIFASLACMMVYFISLKVGTGLKPGTDLKSGSGNRFKTWSRFKTWNRFKTWKWEVESNNGNRDFSLFTFHFSLIIPAVVAAFMLCFAITFWEQAVIAEKYALNALFATLLIFILLKWQETIVEVKNPKSKIQNPKFYLYLFALTLGLSFTHHMQTIYLVPASIFFITIAWWQNKKPSTLNLEPSILIKLICCFVLPLFLYLYLPLRASVHPPLNWGDPVTFPRFMDYITLKAYAHFFVSSPQIWLQNLQHHLTNFFPHQFTIWIVPLGIVGLILLIAEKRRTGIFLLLILLTDIAASIRYGISNIEDYYIPGYIIFSIFIGYGLMGTARLIPKPLLITPFILLPIIPYTTHHFHCDHRNYFFAHDLGVSLIKNLDENAALFIKGDVNGFPVWYLHYVENKRQDVALIDTPFLFQDWYAKEIKYKYRDMKFELYPTSATELGLARFNEILTQTFDKRPCYQYSDEPVPKGFSTIPVWFFLKILKDNTPKVTILKELEKGATEIILRGTNAPEVSKDEKAFDIIRNCAGGYNNRGNNYLGMELYEKAIEELNKSAKIDANLPIVHYNLGRAYSGKKMISEAITNFKKALELNPNLTDIHRRMALLYEGSGQVDEAISEYLEEVKIAPSIELYTTLARLYYGKKEINKVIEQCQNILRLDPNNYEALKNMASLYFTQNRLEEAKRAFTTLLSKYPNDGYAQNMLRTIQNKTP